MSRVGWAVTAADCCAATDNAGRTLGRCDSVARRRCSSAVADADATKCRASFVFRSSIVSVKCVFSLLFLKTHPRTGLLRLLLGKFDTNTSCFVGGANMFTSVL